MKVLVTGATGFVGRSITEKLLDQGHDVRVLSRSGNLNFKFDSSKIEICRGDVTDLQSVNLACENVHTVFHLAGLIGYSRALRAQMQQTNVGGTQNIIDAVKKNNCKKLVYMSSVVAIGASFDGKTPLDETATFNLHHLDLGYFETKHSAEKLIKTATDAGEIDAVILNPSTIYGAGDATKGSRKTQIKVAQGKFPFYTSGGVNVIHIDDVIDACIKAWQVGRTGERYILAGENISIKRLFELIAQSSGVRPPNIYLPNPVVLTLGKVGDFLESIGRRGPINSENAWTSILYHWFDNSKARKELSLNPRPAADAIFESVNWMRQNEIL